MLSALRAKLIAVILGPSGLGIFAQAKSFQLTVRVLITFDLEEGIINLIDSLYPGIKKNYILINKHEPYTIYPDWHPVNRFRFLKKIRGGIRIKNLINKIAVKHAGYFFEIV